MIVEDSTSVVLNVGDELASNGTIVAIPNGDSGPFKNSSNRSNSSLKSSSMSSSLSSVFSVVESVIIPTGIHMSKSGFTWLSSCSVLLRKLSMIDIASSDLAVVTSELSVEASIDC